MGANHSISLSLDPRTTLLIYEVAQNTSKTEKVKTLVSVTSTFRHMSNTTLWLFNRMQNVRHVNSLKLVSACLVPISIANIGHRIFSTSPSSCEGLDSALEVISDVGTMGDAVATFAEGLSSIGVVAASIATWATPLFVVGVGLQIGGLVLSIKRLIQAHRFSKEFDQLAGLKKTVEEYTLEDYQQGLQLIKQKQLAEKNFIAKHFTTKEDSFVERLIVIANQAKEALKSSDPKEVLETKKQLHATMESLSKRITSKNWSHRLTVLAIVISFIAVALLFTPFFPVGSALMAVAGTIALGNLVATVIKSKRFEERLEIDKKVAA